MDIASVATGDIYTNPGFQLGVLYSTDTLRKDVEEFTLYVLGSRCYGYCFKGETDLIFIIDGNRVPALVFDELSNSAHFTIPRSLLTRLAEAKLVEFQVGRYEGKWKGKTLENFKTLLALTKLDP